MEFIGCVKTAHAHFPKTYLEKALSPHPAGSRCTLLATVEGVELVAIGYKYNKRKVLLFVATKGAALTLDGEPYIQRWADEHGNVLSRPIPRPAVLSGYFSVSPRVDNHNQSRQRHDLALEEHWQTQCCWFRLHTTMIGINVTDAWKLTRYHT